MVGAVRIVMVMVLVMTVTSDSLKMELSSPPFIGDRCGFVQVAFYAHIVVKFAVLLCIVAH